MIFAPLSKICKFVPFLKRFSHVETSKMDPNKNLGQKYKLDGPSDHNDDDGDGQLATLIVDSPCLAESRGRCW